MTALDFWVRTMQWGRVCGCHQRPERSFTVRGYQFPLCARCTGVALGQLAGLLPVGKRLRPKAAAALLAPLALDGVTQLAGLQTSNNRRRLVTGILAGVGTTALLRAGWRALKRSV